MPPSLAIVGPTASGKSAFAFELARQQPDLEIVSADAMQVYRGMDIGTAKPTTAEQAAVPHHLIDVVDPSEDFSLVQFLERARAAIADIEAQGHRALLVGGTGLYVQALVDDLEVPGQWPEVRSELEQELDTAALHRRLAELDPIASTRMEPSNRRRIVRALEVTLGAGRPFSSFGPGLGAYPPTSTRLLGLRPALAELDARIEARVHAMLAAGWLDEIQGLLDRGPLSTSARQALGYRELVEHLERGTPIEEVVPVIVARTRHFARRQIRWFRRDPRIAWFDAGLSPSVLVRSVTQ